jgi:OOP family OmpA-OmpF porin
VCPTVKGVASLRGCPDSDGDGLADKDDKCPNEKGPMVSNGCPDSDGDGISDNEDKCPTVPGIAANNGCPATDLAPEVKTEVQNKLNFAAKNIEFETGSDRIRTTSFKDLDNVVAIMNQYKDLKVNIDGHTDNVGKESANVDLSMRRAIAVNDYLVKKGISQNRLAASGYGPSKPIATNATVEGRQKNRRVELNIK